MGEHGEALEADLIDKGLRLRDVGSEWFTWRDLMVIVKEAGRESALMRSMHPDVHVWGKAEYLLADILDVQKLLFWSKTKDGQKGRHRPEPYPRPGVEKPGVKQVKGTAVPMDQVRARLRAIQGGAA